MVIGGLTCASTPGSGSQRYHLSIRTDAKVARRLARDGRGISQSRQRLSNEIDFIATRQSRFFDKKAPLQNHH